MKFTLEHPVEYKNETVSELQLRRLVVADMEAIDPITANMKRGIALVALCSGQPEDFVRLIDAKDFTKLNETIGTNFL